VGFEHENEDDHWDEAQLGFSDRLSSPLEKPLLAADVSLLIIHPEERRKMNRTHVHCQFLKL
jgi:hypothetical protein